MKEQVNDYLDEAKIFKVDIFEFDLDYLSSSTSVAFCSSFKSFASTLSSKVCILLATASAALFADNQDFC